MIFDKFISGRFHQFRAQKSYLAAHQPYYNRGFSTLCPRCHLSDEDLQHAVLDCSLRQIQRQEFIPDLENIDDIWSSSPLLNDVVNYLHATKTGFPISWSGWYPLSPSIASDVLSEVDSISSSIFSLPV